MKVTPQMMAKFENCKFSQVQKVFDLLKSQAIFDEVLGKICGEKLACHKYGK